MGNKPQALHLKAYIGSELFVLGTLSFNAQEREFSYYFHFSEDAPAKQLNLERGILTDPIHHITWHKSNMHIRTESEKLHIVKYPSKSLFPQQKTVKPIYVEGFYINDDLLFLRRDASWPNWSNSNEVLIINSNQMCNFSLIFLLVPSDWETPDLISRSYIMLKNGDEVPLLSIFTEVPQIGRIDIGNGWSVLVTSSPYTRKLQGVLPNVGSSYRLPDFESPTDSLASMVEQNC